MKVCRSLDSLRSALDAAGPTRVGFVPTMGSLHAGHLSLVRACRQENELAVASIYVNPAQFGPAEDFQRYPRQPERDIALLEGERIDLLFMPDSAEIYPPGYKTYVSVEGLENALCGKSRPGHFRGVATVVLKLLNLVGPQRAYFGQKDAQQAIIILRLVRDLHLPVQIRVLPIVRDSDGLALSSRNVFLATDERRAALRLPRALAGAEVQINRGERNAAAIRNAIAAELAMDPQVKPEYIAVVRPRDLVALETVEANTLIAAAIQVGKTRLIDNLLLGDLSC